MGASQNIHYIVTSSSARNIWWEPPKRAYGPARAGVAHAWW